MSVAVMTPFFFIGFDVIPQAAEEINVPLKKIGMIIDVIYHTSSCIYALIIKGVGYVMSPSDISSSQARSGLVTADAMAKAFHSSICRKKYTLNCQIHRHSAVPLLAYIYSSSVFSLRIIVLY